MDLADILIDCRVVTRDQWEEATQAGGGDLGRVLDELAASRPAWWDGKPPAPPGLTAYQRDVIEFWAASGDLTSLRRDLALNQFILLEKLGQGGQGHVYHGRQLNPARSVALKTLVRDTEASRQRFEQEARTMMRVRHPAVARFHQYERIRDADGRPTDEYLIAMEFVNGTPLGRLVGEAGPVPWPFAARWAADLLGGLAEIHRLGFVHRDVKPDNVMAIGPAPAAGVPPDATAVKLLDFGAVKQADPSGEGDTRPEKVFIGTVEYASPEQWAGEALPASDVYALGGTLFYLLAGRGPFKKEQRDVAAYRHSHRHDPAPDVRKLAPDVPNSIGQLIRRMMAKKPADRGTAAELMEEFRRTLPRSPAPPATPRPAARPAAAKAPQPAPAAAREPAARTPLDPVLSALERVFTPAHLRPQPGEELAPLERMTALLRRPAVLVVLLALVALVAVLAWSIR
jgi:serine/threonine protein kinase